MLADGCFDPLHLGHICYFHAAAALEDLLIVQIAPDDAIRAKGREPFQTREERARTIEELACVDYTVMFDSLADAISVVQPRILVKGNDWRGRLPSLITAMCQEYDVRIVYVDAQRRTSTERLRA